MLPTRHSQRSTAFERNEVTAELNRTTDSTTKVEITARKSAVEYDKELAKDILKTVPRPANADQVVLSKWKELGADGVVVAIGG